MKLILPLFFLITLSSCYPIKKLPEDLDRSLLLVQLYPVDTNELRTTFFNGGFTSEDLKKNVKRNNKLVEQFKAYPYKYKLCKESDFKTLSDTGLTYILRYWVSNTHNRYASQAFSSYTTRDIVIQNYHKNTFNKICRVTTGIGGLAPKFIRKAQKLKHNTE